MDLLGHSIDPVHRAIPAVVGIEDVLASAEYSEYQVITAK
jgi:hypothetical protein